MNEFNVNSLLAFFKYLLKLYTIIKIYNWD